jgi:hypothetical protein
VKGDFEMLITWVSALVIGLIFWAGIVILTATL